MFSDNSSAGSLHFADEDSNVRHVDQMKRHVVCTPKKFMIHANKQTKRQSLAQNKAGMISIKKMLS